MIIKITKLGFAIYLGIWKMSFFSAISLNRQNSIYLYLQFISILYIYFSLTFLFVWCAFSYRNTSLHGTGACPMNLKIRIQCRAVWRRGQASPCVRWHHRTVQVLGLSYLASVVPYFLSATDFRASSLQVK